MTGSDRAGSGSGEPLGSEDMQALFDSASQAVGAYFQTLRRIPERGTIEVGGERYTLVRAGALSVGFFDVVRGLYPAAEETTASAVARGVLYDVAHGMGLADAEVFAERMNLSHPLARLSAGPVHFAHSGWASVELLEGSVTTPDENFFLVYDHPYSFESDAWLSEGRRSDLPVCVMNAGYSSGWCESSFGIPLVSVELTCRARGDDRCHFVMAPPDKVRIRIDSYLADNEELRERVGRYEVAGFFARDEAAAMLRVSESELREANVELERRVQERTAMLESMNQQLKQELSRRVEEERKRRHMEQRVLESRRLESLGVMAGGVAHDFNNLLAGVLGHAELLAVGLQDGQSRTVLKERVDLIRRSALRASDLTQQMLNYTGRGMRVSERLDVSEHVWKILQLLRSSIPPSVQLDTDLAKGLPMTLADPGQFQQVVMNLVLNASEALSNSGGNIVVDTFESKLSATDLADCRMAEFASPGSYLCLRVSDNGPGVEAAVLDKIFEPFFTTKFTGRGLGLSALRGIVAGHRGAIRLRTARGEGTTFEVFFPESGEVVGQVDHVPTDTRELAGTMVLVVDDEHDVRAVTVEMLVAVGLEPVSCSDGVQALQVLESMESLPGVVILDLTMPVLGGVETLEVLRERYLNLPVVLVSGFGIPNEEIQMENTTTFLQKPFSIRELLEAIGQVM